MTGGRRGEHGDPVTPATGPSVPSLFPAILLSLSRSPLPFRYISSWLFRYNECDVTGIRRPPACPGQAAESRHSKDRQAKRAHDERGRASRASRSGRAEESVAQRKKTDQVFAISEKLARKLLPLSELSSLPLSALLLHRHTHTHTHSHTPDRSATHRICRRRPSLM